MKNTILNLTQAEFDVMMREAKMMSYKQDFELLKGFVTDFCGENKIGLTKEQLLKIVSA